MVAYSYNEQWEAVDEAHAHYRLNYIGIVEAAARTAQELLRIKPTHAKLQPYQYVVLAAVGAEENLTYRKLAAEAARLFGVRVHYTTIHKAFKRYAGLIALTALIIALYLGPAEELVVDSTEYTLYAYQEADGGRRKRRRVTAKLVAAWCPDTHMFHAVLVVDGRRNDAPLMEPLVAQLFFKPKKVYADRGFFSRKNIQLLSALGVEPVIRPRENAKTRAKGYPAYKRYMWRYRKLGYRRWALETGYVKRFPEEHALSNLIVKYGDEVRARSLEGAKPLIYARVLLHNAFTLVRFAALKGFKANVTPYLTCA